MSFWSEVYSYKDACDNNPFQELGKFVISLLTLPISNAAVERIFSSLNVTKTKSRNRIASKYEDLDTENVLEEVMTQLN